MRVLVIVFAFIVLGTNSEETRMTKEKCAPCKETLIETGMCGDDASEMPDLINTVMSALDCGACTILVEPECVKEDNENVEEDCDACVEAFDDDHVCEAIVFYQRDEVVRSMKDICHKGCLGKALRTCREHSYYIPTCHSCQLEHYHRGNCEFEKGDPNRVLPACHEPLMCDVEVICTLPDEKRDVIPAPKNPPATPDEVGEVAVGSMSSVCSKENGVYSPKSGNNRATCRLTSSLSSRKIYIQECKKPNFSNVPGTDYAAPLISAGLAMGATAAGFVAGPPGWMVGSAVGGAGLSTLTGLISAAGDPDHVGELQNAVKELTNCVNANFVKIRAEINALWAEKLIQEQKALEDAHYAITDAEERMSQCLSERAQGRTKAVNCGWKTWTLRGTNYDSIKDSLYTVSRLVISLFRKDRNTYGKHFLNALALSLMQSMNKVFHDYVAYCDTAGVNNIQPNMKKCLTTLNQAFWNIEYVARGSDLYEAKNFVGREAWRNAQLIVYKLWRAEVWIDGYEKIKPPGDLALEIEYWTQCKYRDTTYHKTPWFDSIGRTSPSFEYKYVIISDRIGANWDPDLPNPGRNYAAGCYGEMQEVHGRERWNCAWPKAKCKTCFRNPTMNGHCSSCHTNYKVDWKSKMCIYKPVTCAFCNYGDWYDTAVGNAKVSETSESVFSLHHGLYILLGAVCGVGLMYSMKKSKKVEYPALIATDEL